MLVPTTKYHSQTNGESKRYNRTLVGRLHRYKDNIYRAQRDWDVFLHALTYAPTHVYIKKTGACAFILTLSREKSRSLTVSGTKKTIEESSTVSNADLEAGVMELLKHLLQYVGTNSCRARCVHKTNFNR